MCVEKDIEVTQKDDPSFFEVAARGRQQNILGHPNP
jgi:hypothetical protein